MWEILDAIVTSAHSSCASRSASSASFAVCAADRGADDDPRGAGDGVRRAVWVGRDRTGRGRLETDTLRTGAGAALALGARRGALVVRAKGSFEGGGGGGGGAGSADFRVRGSPMKRA